MESWRTVWRVFGRLMPVGALKALLHGLEVDDPNLLQGATTNPPPLMCVQDWLCEGGCVLCYAGWKGAGLETVGHCEEWFARLCFEADAVIGEPAACRWFLNWYDDTSRHTMRAELIPEVRLSIQEKLTAA